MGICKCKKRTELFCFVHKKAVCEQCVCTDHQTCVVKSYVDWLQDPEFEQASCGICKGTLVEGSVVRLQCLDMFHPECLDVYACSLPPNTAQAGYVCPTCAKPMLPTAANTSPIAQQLRAAFASSPWASQILLPDSEKASLGDTPNVPNLEALRNSVTISSPDSPPSAPPSLTHNDALPTSNNTPNSNPYYNTPAPAPTVISVATEKQTAPALHGVSSRKATSRPSPLYPQDDEDEDKYKRKGLMQLFSALGLVSQAPSLEGKRGVRLDPRKLLILFALMASFTTVIVLYLVIMDDTQSITEEE